MGDPGSLRANGIGYMPRETAATVDYPTADPAWLVRVADPETPRAARGMRDVFLVRADGRGERVPRGPNLHRDGDAVAAEIERLRRVAEDVDGKRAVR